MRLTNRQRILCVLTLLILLSFSINYWWISLQGNTSLKSFPNFKQFPNFNAKQSNDYTNGLTNQGRGFHIRQHGPYWILYNYIKAEKNFSKNQGITLVLHGEWINLQQLPRILESWKGPIALTLFTSGDDFQRAKSYLSYIKHCTMYAQYLRSFVSVNLIMHQDFLPKFIPRMERNFFKIFPNCTVEQTKFNFALNYRQKHNLLYPSNLARNVGRLTALTHFILTMNMDFIPSPRIPELFIKMIETLKVENPWKTVFVLPVLDIKYDVGIPKHQNEFKFLNEKHLQDYFNSKSLYIIPYLRDWLTVKEKFTMDIFDKMKRAGPWLANYISVNDYEPFYDENYGSENKMDEIVHMDLLESLNYDFYIVNMGFLWRPIIPGHDFNAEVSMKNKHMIDKQRNVLNLKEFLMNFM